jgi:hypothetical protein
MRKLWLRKLWISKLLLKIAYSREGAKHTEIAKSRIGSFIA